MKEKTYLFITLEIKKARALARMGGAVNRLRSGIHRSVALARTGLVLAGVP